MKTITIPAVYRPIQATVTIPGSKSITNRVLLIAALAQGETVLENALFSDDTHWFSTCLNKLDIPIESDESQARFRLTGMGGNIPSDHADLFVGNAGTAARFITALIALGQGTYHMDGIPRMRERPMGELLLVLQSQGAFIDFEQKTGYIPFTMHSHGFAGGHMRLKANQTSQQLSALLMIAPYAQKDTTIEIEGELVSRSYIDMTCHVMQQFGVVVEQPNAHHFCISSTQRYTPQHYAIEPDASNASYFFAAAALTGGRVCIEHLTRQSCQGDIHFVDVLEDMGCTVHATDTSLEVSGPETLRGVDVDMNDMSDTVQTLAAIAPFASSPVTIRNVEHIRWKETDRLKAVVTELRRIGIRVDEFPDGMRIYPGQPVASAVDTYDDHRMAMSFAVTGLLVPGLVIKDPECTRKTFPDFFTRFQAMLDASAAVSPEPVHTSQAQSTAPSSLGQAANQKSLSN